MTQFEEKPGDDLTALRHVSDTAWAVATLRAIESERPDALFHDPYARTLVGRRGPALVANMPPGFDMGWFMSVRTALLDESVMAVVKARHLDGIVNLACGLDTRAYRLALPSAFTWFDVDLPDVMAYRAKALAGAKHACRIENRSVDLSDDDARRAVLAEAARRCQRLAVVTEGLLLYLSEATVAGLAGDLAALPSTKAWLTDFYGGKAWIRDRPAFQEHLRKANAEAKFLPPDGLGFFARQGWRVVEQRHFLTAAAHFNRPPKGDEASKIWRDAYIVMLELKTPE